MQPLTIDTQLTTRTITRDLDTDYFVETYSYPVQFESPLPYLSRIQFPHSRALLIRTSPTTSFITLHILADVDLYSSFVNFEIDLSTTTLNVNLKDSYVQLSLYTH